MSTHIESAPRATAWHPILFAPEMVRAILLDRKRQTRRIVGGQRRLAESTTQFARGAATWAATDGEVRKRWHERLRCPLGRPGDRLWVREAVSLKNGCWRYEADGRPLNVAGSPLAHDWIASRAREYVPGMFLPRWASRVALEVTEVRLERLQEISDDDARDEGITEQCGLLPHECFRGLWDRINGARRGCDWASNPWVFAVTFRRVL